MILFQFQNNSQSYLSSSASTQGNHRQEGVQSADIGLPTGNGKKLSRSQAQLGQATCFAVASISIVSIHFLWAILCPQAVGTLHM